MISSLRSFTGRKLLCVVYGTGKEPRNHIDRSTKMDFLMPLRSYPRHHLAGEGIFANREVEVVRHPGDPVGQRTDILINTLRHTESGDPLDPISAVIEVKGCWNAELFTALETQLLQGYMVQLGNLVGIYLVGWFEPSKWDFEDGRRGRVPKETVHLVRAQLEQQAAAAPEGFRVRAVVLEIAAP